MKFFGYEINDHTSTRPLELRESTIVTSSIEEIDTLIEYLKFVKQSHLRVHRQRKNMNAHRHFSMWAENYSAPNDLIIITDTSNTDKCNCEDASGYSEMVNSEEYHNLYDLDKLKVMCEYFNKIKNNDFINMHFANEVFYNLNDISPNRKKELILEACNRILAYSPIPEFRRDARLMIGSVCTDEELEKFTKYNVSHEEYNEIIEHRAFCRHEDEKARNAHYAANIETFYHFLMRPSRRRDDEEYLIEWEKERIKMIKSFGEGEVPSAWMSMYADCYKFMAHAETRRANYIQAMDYLSEYLDITEKHLTTVKNGDILSYGNKTFFGNLARRAVYGNGNGCPHAMMTEAIGSDGTRHFAWGFVFYPEDLLYEFKENKTLFPMRDNPRYKSLVKRAECIAEKWIKENG